MIDGKMGPLLMLHADLDAEDRERVMALVSRVAELEATIVSLLAWTYGGACSDCDMFRSAPSRIEFQHHKECGHLETINQALRLLGRPEEEGHDLEDAAAEMQRLALERARAMANQSEGPKP